MRLSACFALLACSAALAALAVPALGQNAKETEKERARALDEAEVVLAEALTAIDSELAWTCLELPREAVVLAGWDEMAEAIAMHEGESVTGYQGVVLGESYVKTTKYCQPNSVVAQVVRVRGIVLRAAPSVVQRAEGDDELHARRRAIDEQRQQLAYVIHHVQRAQ